ncbi:MAG: type II toxin-antitoxin system prevent-host-death family antitoxin [bacterium]
MKIYTYSQARNRLAEVLDEATRGEVVIRRRRGDTFAVVPKSRPRRSPFDVPGIESGITRRELMAAVREARRPRVRPQRAKQVRSSRG